ncbi:alpha/beta fold hydrolase [Sandaracinus amylolyticus]|uniref:alpha/beta fold hydrolase n=1 Tax=Sandaracinus amylolyticus TaxID=927083 RepID=UPI001F199D90|nr:alpha/beta fold hydrolase [Sandaracinus amylolyticus]UJR78229.1 Alpha/beta fold hydrolase [Sandaracinus amylolyticus]
MTIAYGYLHGFASSARSKKGVHLHAALRDRIDLQLAELNRPSFAKLSIDAMLAELDAMHEAHGRPRWRLVGSSLGGWLTARWAELHPERVDRVILLCPAFDIETRWPQLMKPGEFETWRARGELEVADATGALVPLHFAFYEGARAHTAYPRLSCPVTIVHGTRDDRVPIESSRRWLASHPHARLIEVDDGHDLVASLPIIERTMIEDFAL